jgi:hypothetical protein
MIFLGFGLETFLVVHGSIDISTAFSYVYRKDVYDTVKSSDKISQCLLNVQKGKGCNDLV